jgi:hypothetical protein
MVAAGAGCSTACAEHSIMAQVPLPVPGMRHHSSDVQALLFLSPPVQRVPHVQCVESR